MTFDHTIQFIVPPEALALAREINRALDDDDVGGADAYQTELADGRFTYSRPCTVDYAQLAAMLFAAPEILHSVIEADYAKRWPDLTPPTYEQCVEFCSLAECYVDDPQVLELKAADALAA